MDSYLCTMEKGTSLNKYIAQTGFCSRRAADDLIDQKRVTINGAVAKKGNRVMSGDNVRVDGEELLTSKKKIYIMLNKPKGVETTSSKQVSQNIIDFVGHEHRIFPIGRLDKNSEGLILLTNDGDFANKLIHSRYDHEKEYTVTVDRSVNKDFIRAMSGGVPILDRVTLPCEVEKISKNTFRIVLTQGLNRQIRRMCAHLDYRVTLLRRVRLLNLRLGKLPVGKWRNLTSHELADLQKSLAQVPLKKSIDKKYLPPKGKKKVYGKYSAKPAAKPRAGAAKSSRNFKRGKR